MFEHPIWTALGASLIAFVISWCALDGERLVAVWRNNRRNKGRAGWIR